VGPCESPVTHFAPLSNTQQLISLQLAFVSLPHFLSSSLLSFASEVQNDPLLVTFKSSDGLAACTLSLLGSLCSVFMPSTIVPVVASVLVLTFVGSIENASARICSGLAYSSVCVPRMSKIETNTRETSNILVTRENIVYYVEKNIVAIVRIYV